MRGESSVHTSEYAGRDDPIHSFIMEKLIKAHSPWIKRTISGLKQIRLYKYIFITFHEMTRLLCFVPNPCTPVGF